MIHQLADVQADNIGEGTKIWQFCVILPGARIGRECNICANCFVEGGARIGNNVTIKCGVQVWDGITLEDNVFVGPNVTFCNDKNPVSGNKAFRRMDVIVKNGASIGANATILPGVIIGQNAIVGAGAVVTKDVADGITVVGNPAKTLEKRKR